MDKSWKIFCMMVLFFIIAGSLEIYNTRNHHIEKGDCFDEKNNKINELTCDIKVIDYNPFLKVIIVSSVIIALIFGVYSIYLAFKGK